MADLTKSERQLVKALEKLGGSGSTPDIVNHVPYGKSNIRDVAPRLERKGVIESYRDGIRKVRVLSEAPG